MKWLIAPVLLVLAACAGPDEAASVALVDRFHTALNASDWPAIDALLSQSSRDLRPGAARAFRAILARHGRYLGGELAGINAEAGRTSLHWAARYERGPVPEYFVLVEEGGGLKIDSYTDKPLP